MIYLAKRNLAKYHFGQTAFGQTIHSAERFSTNDPVPTVSNLEIDDFNFSLIASLEDLADSSLWVKTPWERKLSFSTSEVPSVTTEMQSVPLLLKLLLNHWTAFHFLLEKSSSISTERNEHLQSVNPLMAQRLPNALLQKCTQHRSYFKPPAKPAST